MDQTYPFIRIIQPEEMWLYKYPMRSSYVPTFYLWLLVFCVPVSLIVYDYIKNKDRMETSQAILSLSLNYGLTGLLTTFFKNIVGRPRPDFYYRCFPDGIGNDKLECTGNIRTIMDGRKSFPSGHSSFAFASMVFVSLYLSGKLHVFNTNGRGQTWRLLVVIFPLVVASAIAISRTCDYHHHWQGKDINTVAELQSRKIHSAGGAKAQRGLFIFWTFLYIINKL